MAAEKALTGDNDEEQENKKDEKTKDGWTEFQEPLLLQLLAEEIGCEVPGIADFELNLYDIQKASLGGVHSEFIHSARLDNLASCFLAVQALVEHSKDLADDADVSLVALFDHEEVGSSSAVGAGSPIMGEAVEQVRPARLQWFRLTTTSECNTSNVFIPHFL
jgi:aspartyl aminopeptidase